MTYLLWTIYTALLAVLLPHTAWTFAQFEPPAWAWLGWVAALAFEGAIAAFTWRLKLQIEQSPRRASTWKRLRHRYLNVYSAGLAVAIAISAAANWAHSVQFARDLTIFDRYQIPPLLYSLAFGAILPLCSLLFARILADVRDSEQDQDAETADLRRTVAELRRALAQAEGRAATAEQRFAAAGDIFVRLTSDSKRVRILAARQQWPALPAAAVAILAGAAPSYVSEVLSEVQP